MTYGTSYSRVVPHHSTDDAITSLTSKIGRDLVLSGVNGRDLELELPLSKFSLLLSFLESNPVFICLFFRAGRRL
ncbi:hypothetical protein BB558_006997 [Smittium angustum]|uniref:Uncharacterized protein n=1 Tax=Smittium angustum TaxID=133377 RepID=A0A2U1IWA1_SMIAN|nr:hypothetical protein BB558_006997 [Smittium angustum]